MVEPISIGVVVSALLARALSRAEDGVVDAAVQVAQRAVETLKTRLRGDSEAEAALEALVDAPDSGRREKALAELLEARAERSPELMGELRSIIEQAEAAGIEIGAIEQVAEGEGIVQNAGIVNSEINVGREPSTRSRD